MNKLNFSRLMQGIFIGFAAFYMCGFFIMFVVGMVYIVKDGATPNGSHQKISDAVTWNTVYSATWPLTLYMLMDPNIPRQ